MSEVNTPAQAAANWWADAIKAPRYDNGDPVTSMLATVLDADRARPTTSQQVRFADALQQRIEALLERMGEFGCTLTVDYGPDLILREAAEDAGLSSQEFPWKTRMWVYSDYVTVSAGYRARTVLVWASPDWLANRPACESQKYDEAKYVSNHDYHGEPWQCSLPKYHDGDCRYDTPLALCGMCGRPDGWYHDPDERGHMSDFHVFGAAR